MGSCQSPCTLSPAPISDTCLVRKSDVPWETGSAAGPRLRTQLVRLHTRGLAESAPLLSSRVSRLMLCLIEMKNFWCLNTFVFI